MWGIGIVIGGMGIVIGGKYKEGEGGRGCDGDRGGGDL